MIADHRPRVPILAVRDLAIVYATRQGDVPAVRGVSFDIQRGETLGIVGESGCGKSTVAFGIVNFLGANGRIVSGEILFQGQNLVGKSEGTCARFAGIASPWCIRIPCRRSTPRCAWATRWPRC
jgi:peptide/nickel transport system ATP-binding protein